MFSKSLGYSAIVLLISVGFIACSSNENGLGTTNLNFEIEGVFGSIDLSTTTNLDLNGTAIQIKDARFYVSNVVLFYQDGREIAFSESPIFVPAKDGDTNIIYKISEKIGFFRHDKNLNILSLGEVPSGPYTGFRFDIGLRGLTNKVDPNSLPTGHPLEKQTDVDNHWDIETGYIFFRFEGHQDLDADSQVDETEEAHWWLHLGTADMLRTIEITHPFRLDSDSENALRILFDYKELLEAYGENLPKTYTKNNIEQATIGADALQKVVQFNGIHRK